MNDLGQGKGGRDKLWMKGKTNRPEEQQMKIYFERWTYIKRMADMLDEN